MDSAAFHAVSCISAFLDFKQQSGCRKDAIRWHRQSPALDATVVVAVVAVRMVKMIVHQVINVVAVRNRLMAAVRAVLVTLLVRSTFMVRRAGRRVRRADRQGMFLDLAAILVVQVAVVQVIDVSIVLDGRVPAVGAVLVGVAFVMSCHVQSFPF